MLGVHSVRSGPRSALRFWVDTIPCPFAFHVPSIPIPVAATDHCNPIVRTALAIMMPFMHWLSSELQVKSVLLAAIADLAAGLVMLHQAGTTWMGWADWFVVFSMCFCLLEHTAIAAE